jgi:murein DD-endopeptidase MepM/ murein hydrolase activator NlpD
LISYILILVRMLALYLGRYFQIIRTHRQAKYLVAAISCFILSDLLLLGWVIANFSLFTNPSAQAHTPTQHIASPSPTPFPGEYRNTYAYSGKTSGPEPELQFFPIINRYLRQPTQVTSPEPTASPTSTPVQVTAPVPGPKIPLAKAESREGFIIPIKHNGITRGLIRGIHKGIDYRAYMGTPVVSAAHGKVIEADSTGWNGGWGKYVLIDHGNGKTTRYAHLNKISVITGQEVKQGDIVGYSGSSGRSTGPHLHFEYRLNGRAVDPTPLFR